MPVTGVQTCALPIYDVQAVMSSVKQQVLALRLENEGLNPERVQRLTDA